MNFGQWIGIICLIAASIVVWEIRELLLLIFAAVVLATAFNSLVRRFQASGVKRNLAIAVTLGATVLIGLLFGWLIFPPFIDQFVQLVRALPTAVTQIVDRLDALIEQRLSWLPLDIELPDTTDIAGQLRPLAQNALQELFTFFSTSLNALLKVLLVAILTVMMLVNPSAYRNTFVQLFPSFYRRRADHILTKCEIALGNWMAGLLVSSSVVAALSATGLSILRVNFVLAHALLAGLLNFIPNIGPTLSLVFPLIVALQDAPWKAIGVLILYFVIQQAESYLVTPTVMQQQVSLLPAITLIAQIFFANLFGLLGLLLALPLAVVAKTWIEEALIKDILNPWKRKSMAVVDHPIVIAEEQPELAALPADRSLPPDSPSPDDSPSHSTSSATDHGSD
ncbi:MAG: AI-2E family transporter [Leptolyngbyaceae cyanobacterium SL_7_1]|nr:AI-2E family transporter [Leptolyngbyaceae cyanobacterium SL_7_1]